MVWCYAPVKKSLLICIMVKIGEWKWLMSADFSSERVSVYEWLPMSRGNREVLDGWCDRTLSHNLCSSTTAQCVPQGSDTTQGSVHEDWLFVSQEFPCWTLFLRQSVNEEQADDTVTDDNVFSCAALVVGSRQQCSGCPVPCPKAWPMHVHIHGSC